MITDPESTGTTGSRLDWLKRKINYGATYKGMITFTIVWEFVIILFLSTFSEPVKLILGGPLLELNLPMDDISRAGRLILLYHGLAVPFIAVCAYFVLEFMDVREKFKSRVKWPLFIGSILASANAILYAYIFPEGWILQWIISCRAFIVFLCRSYASSRSFPNQIFSYS